MINIYFRKQPQRYKYIPGDRQIFSFLRRLFKGRKISGIEKVFINLCKGFDQLKIDYSINKPFNRIKPEEPVIVLGNGKYALQGYTQPNPIIAGIGLMTHPHEWPTMFEEYPVAKYLQHSTWTNNIYAAYYGKDKCEVWPAGIDTDRWSPDLKILKKKDFLIYNKIMWNQAQTNDELRNRVLNKLNQLGLTYNEIVYGQYAEVEYFNLLKECSAMIFLCEHESQGFACCEALSMNVPVFAWDQGLWLDPNRFSWGEKNPVPTTSIPFFSADCGMSFKNLEEFHDQIDAFWKKVKSENFHPRDYILKNLTLKNSAQRMLEIVDSVYK